VNDHHKNVVGHFIASLLYNDMIYVMQRLLIRGE